MATADEPRTTPAGHGPRVKVDEHGRAVPLTPEEQRHHAEGILRMLEELKGIENGPDEDDRDFFRAMDEARPNCPPSKHLDLY